jgi:hypothetical protein
VVSLYEFDCRECAGASGANLTSSTSLAIADDIGSHWSLADTLVASPASLAVVGLLAKVGLVGLEDT